MTNWRDKLRGWIDGDDFEETDKVLIQKSANYESENFLRKLLQKVDEVLKLEIVRLPNGKAYVPNRFIVYLNEEDDKNLRKDKRKFFEQALSEMILDKAQERAGNAKLNTQMIKVSLDVNDGEEIKVVAVSDGSVDLSQSSPIEDKVSDVPIIKKKSQEDIHQAKTIRNVGTIRDVGTIEDTDFDFNPLYKLEVFRDGKLLNTFPIIKSAITVGREEDDSEANIRLKSDNRKISRLHAGIEYKDNGEVWVTALNKNPTFVSGKAITKDEKTKLAKNGEIQIYEYTLRLKF